MQAIHFLRLPTVMERRGRGRASTYKDIADGILTKPVKISVGNVGWPDYEIDLLNRARIAGQDDAAIKELVRDLHERRKVAE